MNYKYFFQKQPIQRASFIQSVPKGWEKELVNGFYSYGYYSCILIDQNL